MKKKIILFVSLLLTTLLISVALWIYQDLNTIVVKDLSPDKNSLILYIKDGKTNILFDVGDNERELMIALEKNNLALKDIDYILISHKHKGHTGGILSIDTDLLNKKTKIVINKQIYDEIINEYGSNIEKLNILKPEKTINITSRILYSNHVKRIKKTKRYISESFVVIKKNNNIGILSACAHPSLNDTFEQIKKDISYKKIIFLAGGLSNLTPERINFIDKNNLIVYPIHCSYPIEKLPIDKIKQFPIIIK